MFGLLAVSLLAGCNRDTAPAPTTVADSGAKKYKIGFANLTEDIPFAVRVREGIEKAAKANNVELVVADNKLDGATALANADNFITQGVDGVIEFQTDENFGKSIMSKMNAKKIPVIAIDIPMQGATFFGVNNKVAGEMAGKGLGEWIKKNWDGEAGHAFRREDVDVIFLHVTTYALSSTVLPVLRRAGVPVIVLNLQPEAALDYRAFNQIGDRTRMTGEWLAFCAACPVPEIANVLKRVGLDFHQVTGILGASRDDDPACWNAIDDWIEAARVKNVMEHNRLGLMGHYYNGMLDIYSDVTLQCATFGGHIEILEVDELAARRREVSDAQIGARIGELEREFEVQSDCSRAELERAARTSVALDRLVADHDLGSLAYYYMGTGVPENEDTISSIILGSSLLTARGVPVAGEYEVKNAQAMKIMDSFGVGGSFSEYYAMDFDDDVVLMGHGGPGHIAIAQGKTRVRPLEVYHGKVGRGLSVEMSVKYGPVTLLSVVESAGGLKLLVAQGESVAGPILEIGNTNSRYRFSIGARQFVNSWNAHGTAHHCAIGVGHIAPRLEKLAALLNIEMLRHVARVCGDTRSFGYSQLNAFWPQPRSGTMPPALGEALLRHHYLVAPRGRFQSRSRALHDGISFGPPDLSDPKEFFDVEVKADIEKRIEGEICQG